MPIAVDVRPEASDSITIPAGIISQLSGVHLQIPDGEHSASEPGSTADWVIPGTALVLGLCHLTLALGRQL
jgi:hypothetical protein